ncbi:MAG: hypothetical protein F6K24_08575 [Okeania sp. SIO2D1]|nr:hypothetical protein [Okeania sp. SIO2D1]
MKLPISRPVWKRFLKFLALVLAIFVGLSNAALANSDKDMVDRVMNKVVSHCGSVKYGIGANEDTHKDFELSNNQYCDCYSYLWSQRDKPDFRNIQFIYHEPSACDDYHIHVEKWPTCYSGKYQYVIDDESPKESPCTANRLGDVDRTFSNAQCSSPGSYNKLVNTCNNPDGTIVIHAEDYQGNVARSDHSWQFRNWSNKPGWTGGGAMQVLPKDPHININSDYVNVSPELRYTVNFPDGNTTYYVWIYGWGNNTKEDSVHVGLNGGVQPGAQRMSCSEWAESSWGWCSWTLAGQRASIYVPQAGTYTLNVWMRENGFRFDKIHLTKLLNYHP